MFAKEPTRTEFGLPACNPNFLPGIFETTGPCVIFR